MNLLKFSALTIAIAASGSVDAMTTYTLHLEGTALHFFSPYECPDGPIGEDGNCVPPQETRPWRGTLELTAPDGDGTYLHNGMNLALTLSESTGMFYPSGHFLLSYPEHFQVEISGGQVVSLVGQQSLFPGLISQIVGFPQTATWTFTGMTVSAIEENPFTGLTRSFGVITAAVPEPQTWALLLVGFASIGGLVRRRGDRAASAVAAPRPVHTATRSRRSPRMIPPKSTDELG